MRARGKPMAARTRGCVAWWIAWSLGGLSGCVDSEPPSARPDDPFADRVVAFDPGPGAGYGSDKMPQVVLGPPRGKGEAAGGLDVLSLGRGGEIVLAFDDWMAVDGPGPDLLVFENPFGPWREPGEVSASADGVTWHTWPCAATDTSGSFEGCAGLMPVRSSPDNAIPATDPMQAGGDAFDLQQLGLTHARFVRIRDVGSLPIEGKTSGFDLDAVAVVNGQPVP